MGPTPCQILAWLKLLLWTLLGLTWVYSTVPVWCHASCLRCLACMLSPGPRCFGFPFAASGPAASGPHPLSNVSMAQAASVDFAWLGLGVLYFTCLVSCFMSPLCCPYAIPKSSLFRFAFAALGRAASGPHPLSNFSLAKAASVDFAWLDFCVICFACLVPPCMSSLFGFYVSPMSSLCLFFCCCIRSNRQRAPPPIKF